MLAEEPFGARTREVQYEGNRRTCGAAIKTLSFCSTMYCKDHVRQWVHCYTVWLVKRPLSRLMLSETTDGNTGEHKNLADIVFFWQSDFFLSFFWLQEKLCQHAQLLPEAGVHSVSAVSVSAERFSCRVFCVILVKFKLVQNNSYILKTQSLNTLKQKNTQPFNTIPQRKSFQDDTTRYPFSAVSAPIQFHSHRVSAYIHYRAPRYYPGFLIQL